MSTKWNNAQKLQKTPKVCKKQPPAFPPEFDEFQYHTLQAFASWSNPFSPLDGEIAGMVQLHAVPESHLHFGRILGVTHDIELDLIYDPDNETFYYTISLMAGSTVIDQRSVEFTSPTATLPFVAGLFTFDNDGTTSTVKSKIYS